MNVTNIEWTTFSANPLKYRDADGKTVWACVHASKGCEHCYAEDLAKRYGRGGPFNVPTTSKVTPYLDEKELRQMLTATSIKGVPVSGSRVFVGDMTDVFGPWVPDELLDQMFAVFALRSDVTWQLLTKRADRMRQYLRDDWMPARARWIDVLRSWLTRGDALVLTTKRRDPISDYIMAHGWPALNPEHGWPLPNVWLGVSAEDQHRANERIPLLLQTPAAVRFVSAEPLIASIDFHSPVLQADSDGYLDWVIAGGESGPGARPCDVGWIRAVVAQCADAGVACFVKQLGSYVRWDGCQGGYGDGPSNVWPRATGNVPDGSAFRKHLVDRKGGDPYEWPSDLRVRQFPTAESAEWRERRSAR